MTAIERTARAKILVVDDEEETRALFGETLSAAGYDVVSAADGLEALRLQAAAQPDLVLLDLRLPGIDGYSVCDAIRATRPGDEPAIVFVTGLHDGATSEHVIASGADDLLEKPLRADELLVRVRALLRAKAQARQTRERLERMERERDELLRAMRDRQQLAEFVVHDLKNPVNAIGLQARLLGRIGNTSDGVRAIARDIVDQSQRLGHLIGDLLDISKAEGGALQLRREWIDVGHLFAGVLDGARVTANERKVRLAAHIHPDAMRVRADANLIRRLLDNLVDNALRHVPTLGSVTLTARGTASTVKLTVADDGCGIPPQFREKIFDKYVQLAPVGLRAERLGRGLGLRFCRMVAEAHGGTIHVEPSDIGAVFAIELPRDVDSWATKPSLGDDADRDPAREGSLRRSEDSIAR